jgi:hypothetical protein
MINTVHFTIAIRAVRTKADDALKFPVKAPKKLDVTAVAEPALKRVTLRPGKTAATIMPLVLMACTPAALGFAGFTAGGIAAGLST